MPRLAFKFTHSPCLSINKKNKTTNNNKQQTTNQKQKQKQDVQRREKGHAYTFSEATGSLLGVSLSIVHALSYGDVIRQPVQYDFDTVRRHAL